MPKLLQIGGQNRWRCKINVSFICLFRAKNVYVGGLLVYSTGMMLMALTKHKVGVILFSWTAGVMYSTLFTMPYLLVAHYHAKGTVRTFTCSMTNEVRLGLIVVSSVWGRRRRSVQVGKPDKGTRDWCGIGLQHGVHGSVHLVHAHGHHCQSIWHHHGRGQRGQRLGVLWGHICHSGHVLGFINSNSSPV